MANNLVELCRYYRGEKTNPYEGKDQNKSRFWEYEKLWVEQTRIIENEGEDSEALKFLGQMISDYQNAGLWDFEVFDHVPLPLKAILFNRYQNWLEGSPDDFKIWYKENYLK